LTETGEINEHHTYMRTGVVDVGTYTVDLALDDNGEFVDAESGSVESGVYTCQDRFGIPQNDHLENPQLKRSVKGWSG
jgi:flagellar hook protein FlgE